MSKHTDETNTPADAERTPVPAAKPETPPALRVAARAARKPAPARAGAGRPLPAGSGPGARIRVTSRAPGGDAPATAIIHRRPRAPFVLLGLVIVLLTAGMGAYGVVSAGFFRVSRVTVQGAALVPSDDIARASGVVGQDLFDVDPAAVEARVIRLSGVRQAVVQKQWPRRVVVQVEERRPVAVWQVGGVGYLVDEDGVVLDFSPDPNLITIVETDGARSLVAGDRLDGDAVMLATRLREVMPLSVGQRPVRFEWSQSTGLEVTTEQGLRVRLGDGQDLDYKLAVWRGILERANRDKTSVSAIDLRFGDRVYFR